MGSKIHSPRPHRTQKFPGDALETEVLSLDFEAAICTNEDQLWTDCLVNNACGFFKD